MRVLVTGGAGFIGTNLVRALLAESGVEQVVVLDDLSTGHERNLAGLDLRFVRGSILDAEVVSAAVQDADAVVHLAARPSVPRSLQDPWSAHDVNATGTVRVLMAAASRGTHTVVASSSSVYGPSSSVLKHEDLPSAPVSPYAASKAAAEAYSQAWAAAYGVPLTLFRFFNVFGPWQRAGHAYAAVIPAFVEAALGSRPLPVHGDGTQSRDFTYVGDVVAVLVRAVLDRLVSPRPVNLAFGTRRTLLEVIAELEDILGVTLRRDHLPPRAADVNHTQADTVRLRALVPDVRATSFRPSLEVTVQWARDACRS